MNDFQGFLRHAIEHSECNIYIVKHFRHSDAKYIFKGDIEAFERDLKQLN